MIINGFYETIVIIFIFPLIVIIGAGENEENEKILKICKFAGEFSYPLYITHYPLVYCQMSWYYYHKDDSLFNKIVVSVGCFFIMMFNTYALMKLYDEPVRKWLTEKILVKKKKKDEKEEKIFTDNFDKNDNNKIIDETENDKEDNKKNKLLEQNGINNS